MRVPLQGSVWPEGRDVAPLHHPLQRMLEASTALHRHMAAEITQRWISPEIACQLSTAQRAPTPPPAALLTQTVALLTAPTPQYAELAPMHTRLKSESVSPGKHDSTMKKHALGGAHAQFEHISGMVEQL